MNKPFVTKRVAFFASALTQDPLRMEDGILRYLADQPGFVFRSFRYDSEQFDTDDPAEKFNDMPLPWGDWRPDGIIAAIGMPLSLPGWLARDGQPLVITNSEWKGQLPSVYTAPDSIAALAIEHFKKLGYVHYAFVGLDHRTCRMRWESFERKLRAMGHESLLYELETNPLSGLAEAVEKAANEVGLLQLLRNAPKPLAVMTPGDMIAQTVCTACQHLDLSIPNQVAVIGVGNSPAARSCLPPLTSVHTPAKELGYQAMALMDRFLHEGKRRSNTTLEIPATRLVVRQSTQDIGQGGGHAQRLRQLIHDEACLGSSIEQIVAPLNVSLSTLQRQFIAAFGCTPGQELLRVRLKKAKELLLTAEPVKMVATALGYTKTSSFTKFFSKQTGMSPGAFRRGAQQPSAHDTTSSKGRKLAGKT
jgi:LacI family transcriptional regulator